MTTKKKGKAEKPKIAPRTEKWWLIDAKGKVLGRLSTKIANLLRGKGKTEFTPQRICGDFVIVKNIEKVKLTGSKPKAKKYYSHSGVIGNLKVINAKDLLVKNPERLFVHAVKGMLPKNKLRARFLKRLKLYTGDTHPHEAQNPEAIS